MRVLMPGGRLIVVVGDVCLPRRRYGRHVVFPLHASIQEHCHKIGFDNLAPIIWHKIANAQFEVEGNSGFLGKPYEPNGVIKNATSKRPVRIAEPYFPVLSEFQSTSYAARAELLCLKLLRERQYNAVYFLLSNKDSADAENNYSEPNTELSAESFVVGLLNHLGLPRTKL